MSRAWLLAHAGHSHSSTPRALSRSDAHANASAAGVRSSRTVPHRLQCTLGVSSRPVSLEESLTTAPYDTGE